MRTKPMQDGAPDVTVDEILREALALDAADRAAVAHRLLSSLDSLSDAEAEQLWLEEARRRSAEIDDGTATTISAEDALAQARARRE